MFGVHGSGGHAKSMKKSILLILKPWKAIPTTPSTERDKRHQLWSWRIARECRNYHDVLSY
jgi:hypothetical protein